MKSKPARKNFHKERIFGLHQNKTDFEYQKDHQAKIREKAHEIFEKRGRVQGLDWQDWFEAERIILNEQEDSIEKGGRYAKSTIKKISG